MCLDQRNEVFNFSPTSLLVTVLMYDFANHDASGDFWSSFRDICETGWRLRIVIITASVWPDEAKTMLNRRLFCIRQGNYTTKLCTNDRAHSLPMKRFSRSCRNMDLFGKGRDENSKTFSRAYCKIFTRLRLVSVHWGRYDTKVYTYSLLYVAIILYQA